jgi:hypothetical protein
MFAGPAQADETRRPVGTKRMRTRPLFLLSTSLLTLSAKCTTIDITYNFVPAEAQVAIEHAASIWEGILVSPVPIKAMVTWAPLGSSSLGITFPNGRKDFASAPFAQTWYATALANSIAGEELNPGENDFDIFLNSSTSWYYGTDGATPNGQYDLVSAALHEMGHGLGFVGLSKKTGTEGSFGLLEMSDFAPLVTSFPWPELDTLPGIFDRFLAHPQNGPLELMDNPGTALGSAMSSNQVRFNGAYAMEANSGNAPRIYSPSIFALGSSCVHLNESTYPEGNANELMTPFSSAGNANHSPGPLCLAMLRDIGWTLAPAVGLEEYVATSPFELYPNPVTDHLNVRVPLRSSVTAILIDGSGRTLRTMPLANTIDVSDLAPGSYLLRLNGTGQVARFMKD